MSAGSPDDAAAKLRAALDLFAAGESMMREKLRRAYPDAGAEDIEVRLYEWLAERPGAEFGDAGGVPGHLAPPSRMSKLEAALRAFAGRLSDLGQRSALVGGLAVSARTEPRFTRDLDVAVAVEGDAEAEALVERLVSEGYRTLALVEQEATHRLATVRLALPGGDARGVVADVLFASSGIEAEIVRDAERLRVFTTIALPVARVGHLIALKLLSRDDRTRPQDQVDLRALAEAADDPDIWRARDAIRLIDERGFARGRDLRRALEALLASRGG